AFYTVLFDVAARGVLAYTGVELLDAPRNYEFEMPGRRYTIVVEDRTTGAVRRLTFSARPVIAAVCAVASLPVLIGVGAAWKTRSDCSGACSADCNRACSTSRRPLIAVTPWQPRPRRCGPSTDGSPPTWATARIPSPATTTFTLVSTSRATRAIPST